MKHGVLAFLIAVAAHIAFAADVTITPILHSSVQIEHDGFVIQVDPWSRADLSRAKPADLILVTDDPIHHLDPKAIAQLRKPTNPASRSGRAWWRRFAWRSRGAVANDAPRSALHARDANAAAEPVGSGPASAATSARPGSRRPSGTRWTGEPAC